MRQFIILVFMLGAMVCNLSSQITGQENGNTFGRLCGQVADSRFMSTPRATWHLVAAGRPTKAEVLLYRRIGHKKCCSKKDSPVLRGWTENDGTFDLESVLPGHYWMVVVVAKKRYKTTVTVNSSISKVGDCSGLIFQIKDGESQIFPMVELH